ncbi:hypothetical protein [Sphingomonas sp.]|uniref:hypothetical protein n=1 Tax=Sphingomonas sp. TaxID=28214 RepID=UPI003CC663D2
MTAENEVDAALDRLPVALPPSLHEEAIALPELDQVTNWSKADPAGAAHNDKALFSARRTEHKTPVVRDAALRRGQGRR